MTLAEKVGQLTQFSNGAATGPDNVKIDQRRTGRAGRLGSILNLRALKACNDLQRQAVEKSRLKIPILFGLDVIHGHRTVYPIPLGLSAAWDTGLAEALRPHGRRRSDGGRDSLDVFADGRYCPRRPLGKDRRRQRRRPVSRRRDGRRLGPRLPGQKICRTPRRCSPAPSTSSAYGAAEGGRDYNTVDVSERTLRDVYLPPFKAALDAGAGTIMSAFNTLQGCRPPRTAIP